ncbi:uncharacterized protein LOC112092093 [Morus notabilis]|uniref:uncharacterized protein LOC112092093 n=1 Tax=Morus notabilis TaxID=981085 RepID=UPI000CED368A|nr:uncharacterized protein LOC112092093 [Morus notabilis]XP_024023072.1 uncharacterized protein LOC112092093 [Morus notabilis]
MNADNENIEPSTDLGLALGYSSQCVKRRLNNGSGAGANAGSGLNMTFVAQNPLSELVWSPHKGPSNVALLPVQGITVRTDKQISGENFQTSNTYSLQMTSEVARVMHVHAPRREDEIGIGGDTEEIDTAHGATVMKTDQKEGLGDRKGVGVSGRIESQIVKTTETRETNFLTLPGQANRKKTDVLSIKHDHHKPDEAEIEPLSADPIGGDRNVDNSNYSLQMNESEAPSDLIGKHIFHDRRKSLEKIESTSENDLQNFKSEYVCSAANDTVRLEFYPEVKGSSEHAVEDIPPRSKTVSAEHSLTSSRVRVKRKKGKEKALSDGMMPKDDDDSHESVESCNSAGLFPTGKRRRSFEEDLVVGTKGFKKQIHCLDGSTSVARQNSSFMNWISNMMKRFSQSVQDEAPFPLSIVRPDDRHENIDKRLTTVDKNQDAGSKIIGFQSIFQSMYCGKAEVQETRVLNVEYQVGEGSKELGSSNKMSNNNATPIACQGENSKVAGKHFLLLNERFNESMSGNGEALAIQPKNLLDKFVDSQENGHTNSEENKSKCQLAISSKEKERTSSNTSLGKRKTSSAEHDSDLPCEGKTTSKFYHRNDSLGSTWITRFAAKISGSSENPNHFNPSAGLSPKRSVECLKLIPHAQNHIGFHVDSAIFENTDHAMENPIPFYGKESEDSSSRIKSHDDTKSMYKLTPVLPFPQLNHSDAMASVFAKRLDAFKHITSSRVTSDAAHATMTCFFCGVKGHNLRDCSEIKQTELEELLRNLNTCSGIEELPCLCIRCFQRSHWAVACPKTSPSKRLQLESNASFSEMLPSTGNRDSLKLQSDEDMITETDFNSKVDEMMNFQKKLSSTSPVKKHIASVPEENMSIENRIMPFQYIVSEQNSDVPKGLFDAVKRLRLSRSHIIKWKSSRMSLSQLDGFFLRLRLGKWEEGLGGTGYHVACIIGAQGDGKTQDAEGSILVKVGGIKCLVGSRFISNHDFLEDELLAWWSITSRNGDKIPSEEDLGVKVKTKKMLGF